MKKPIAVSDLIRMAEKKRLFVKKQLLAIFFYIGLSVSYGSDSLSEITPEKNFFVADSLSSHSSDSLSNNEVMLEKKEDPVTTEQQAVASFIHKSDIKPAKTVLRTGILFGTFTKEEGPFLIQGNVIVPADQVLEFGQACTVYVGGDYSSITVFGQLFARGTKDEPVVFMSAGRRPQPWDWNRIYCRSSKRSIFENCIIRHANYGIYTENGSVGIYNCRFENNSISGVVAKNAYISIVSSDFTGGHVTALNLLKGAVVSAESLFIKENITAVACSPQSQFKLTGGYIKSNGNGIIAAKGSSIEIVGAEISKNNTGIITETAIPGKSRESVFNNLSDIKIVSSKELEDLIKEPQPIVSVAVSQTEGSPSLPSDFKEGFSASEIPQKTSVDFIGNVTSGFTYFMPRSTFHPYDKDTSEIYLQKGDGSYDTVYYVKPIVRRQTKYPGEQSEKWLGGIQPEIQFFANGRRNNADVNLVMDLYGNQWLSTTNYIGKNLFNISMNYARHSLVIGDFVESSSETSIPGRQITGIKYTGKLLEIEKDDPKIEYKLAAGETEIAKDSGDHEIFIYNQTVDTGMSKRQQITYITEINVKPNNITSFGAKGIISHDQTDRPLFRKTISDPAASNPVSAQTGCISASLFLFDKKAELFGEIDVGSADTLSDSAAKDIAWYNPQLEKAMPKIFSLFNRNSFFDHYAGIIGYKANVNKYNTLIRYLQIAPSYYSAGDPYLINWRKNLNASLEKTINSSFDISASYEYDHTTLKGRIQQSPNVMEVNILSLKSNFKINDKLPSFTIDYSLQHKRNDALERVVKEDTSYTADFKEKEIGNRISVESKHTLNNNFSYNIKYQLLWDNDYGDHPDVLLNDEGDRVHNNISGSFTFKIRQIINNKAGFRISTKFENRDSLRAYLYRISDKLMVQVIPRKLNFSFAGEYGFKSEREYEVGEWRQPFFTKNHSVEAEIKYSFTAMLNISGKFKYEKYYDEIPGSTENYSVKIAGLHLTYLF